MRLIIASNNQGKIKEFAQIFSTIGIDVVSLKEMGLDINVVEDGETFEENSMKKAKEVCQFCGEPSLADDSGLMVDYLNGAPGVYSARFSGEDSTDQKNNQKLLKLLKDVPDNKRTARFVSVISVVFPNGRTFDARGECEGIILNEGRGDNGFGYDPLFYYPEFDKTFAQMNKDEKNRISHRGKALNLLVDELKNNIL